MFQRKTVNLNQFLYGVSAANLYLRVPGLIHFTANSDIHGAMSTASLKEKVKTINPENFAALPLLIEVEQDFLFTNMSFHDHISWVFFRPQYYTITMQRFYFIFPNTDLDRKIFFQLTSI